MTEQAERQDTVRPDPWWVVTARILRWLLGGFSLVCGLTWILLTMHGTNPALDTAVGAVLAAGGLVLLMPHRIRLPRRATAAVVTGVALIGTAAGLLAHRGRECCGFAYVEFRGLPFEWLSRGGVADDPDTAHRLARSAGWSPDLVALTADLLLWSYVGLLLTVVAVLVRRARRTPSGA